MKQLAQGPILADTNYDQRPKWGGDAGLMRKANTRVPAPKQDIILSAIQTTMCYLNINYIWIWKQTHIINNIINRKLDRLWHRTMRNPSFSPRTPQLKTFALATDLQTTTLNINYKPQTLNITLRGQIRWQHVAAFDRGGMPWDFGGYRYCCRMVCHRLLRRAHGVYDWGYLYVFVFVIHIVV